MKLITFAIPCYNSAAYMSKCIDSILVLGDRAEVLVVDDGSTDGTAAIADGYAERYPGIVRAIHKENGGHGSCINRGIEEAAGKYFKVVDSDDWLDGDALETLAGTIEGCAEDGVSPDLFVTNFIYDKVGAGTKYVSRYRKNFRPGMNDWGKVRPFRLWHMMLMHSLLYSTELLRSCGVSVPEHVFYDDNFFAYMPLTYARNVYYLDVDLYHYYIGREGQSVNVRNIIGRYEQQLKIMDAMIYARSYDEIEAMPKGLRKYLKHSLRAILANTMYFTCGASSPERKAALRAMWDKARETDRRMYRFLRYRTYAAILMPLPWKMRGALAGFFYNFLCRVVKLG